LGDFEILIPPELGVRGYEEGGKNVMNIRVYHFSNIL
jgi:hypothetical protein